MDEEKRDILPEGTVAQPEEVVASGEEVVEEIVAETTETVTGSVESGLPTPESVESVESVVAQEVTALPGEVEASYSNAAEGSTSNGMAIGSMVTGVLGLVLSCCVAPLAIILSIVAIVLAVIVFKKNKGLDSYNGKGMAIAGLVLGVIGGLLSIVAMALFAFGMIGSFQENMKDYY